LTTKAELASRYQDALEALGRGDMTRAQDLLVHIVVSDPHYKDVTLHLHRVVTGSDLEDDLQSLGDRQREYEQAKLETRQARSEVKRVKSNLVRMKTEVEKARREIERLAAELNRSEARIQKQVDRRLRQESAIKQQQSQIADLEKKLQEQKEQAKEELEEIRADFHAEKLKTEADHNQRIQAVHREKEELVRKIGECHIARDRFRSERDAARQLNLERDRRIRKVEEKARNYIVVLVIVSILFLLSLGYLLLT
jgi:chromosome segregation ATPase